MNVIKKINLKRTLLSCSTLFRYATSLDYILMVIALIACLLKATVHVMSTVVYSEMVAMLVVRNLSVGTSSKTYTLQVFGGGKILVNATREENMAELRNDSISFGIILTLIAATMFVTGMIHVDLMNVVGLRITTKIKREFFKATLRKDIGWHDVASNQNFAVRITDNMEKVREGISEKLGQCFATCITAVVMIVVSFVFGWKLTLAISIYIPIVLLCNYILAKHQSKLTVRELDSYVNAGNLVEEVIEAVETVKAFGGEKQESDRYEDLLIPARDASKWRGVFSGVEESISKCTLFFASSTAFWFGSQLILNDHNKVVQEYTPAVLMIALFGLLVGAELISKCTPFLDAFATARSSAASIFEVIDSTTKIDPLSLEGKILSTGLRGDIAFRNVFFKYPAREDVLVLREFNLQIQAGQTVALVGHSGCGKSTCLQMLQRLYDPINGCISLDGVDMRLYNVSWLRSNIAIVGQRPVLFQTTIGENIKLGNPDATQKEVEDAAKAANVHDNIMKLPKSYDTRINDRGLQLSVGQKQQIAIARALIQNPKILLLDEPTSGLDYHSEKLVQKALDAAAQGRTTIVVPHRLSAIRSADRIVFMYDGKVAEDGSHKDLMAARGKYFDMVTTQESHSEDVKEDDGPEKVNYFSKDDSSCEQPKTKFNISDSAKMESDCGKNEAMNQTPFFKTFIRILRVARQEWYLLVLGTMCAVIYGCAQPVFAFLFAEFYLALAQIDPDTVLRSTSILTVICLVAGLAAGAVCFFQTYLFISSGVRLTTRLRSLTFRAILGQDIAWFGKIENSVGTLSARLSGDAANIQGAIGYPLSEIIQAMANFVCCLMLAFYFSWQMALACLCTTPFMIASVVFEAKYMSSSAIIEKRILEETSRIATEAIVNVRTVAELRLEHQLIEDYNKDLEQYESQLRKRLRFRGMINASGWSIMFFGYAIALTYGGLHCSEGKIEFQNIIKVSESLLYGLMILALALAFTPSFTTALIAGHRLFQIVDKAPRIQSPYCYENSLMKENSTPSIVEQVSNELNMTIPQEKTVTLEGASVFGKSTFFDLLLRFYDLESAKISIDGPHHRLGIVSQEPVLFERTIAENIAYGDNTRQVSMKEIIEAANIAKAHHFITSLPYGYDTKLGARGTQLSAGQKQKIAIARALVRNPQVLVLDKATLALNPEREWIEKTSSDFVGTCIMDGGQKVEEDAVDG